MNIDRLNMTSPSEAMRAAYHLIDTLQNHPAHLGVAAVSIVLKELSEILRIPVSELLDKAGRITNDLNEHYQPEIVAMREYIRHQIREN